LHAACLCSPSPPLCPAVISTADAYGYDVQYLKGSANTYVDEKKGTTSGHVNVKAYGTPYKPASVGLSATSCIGEHCKEKKEEQEGSKRLLLAAKKPVEHQPAKKEWHNPPKVDWHKPAPAKQSESMCPAHHLDCGCLLHFAGQCVNGKTGPCWQGCIVVVLYPSCVWLLPVVLPMLMVYAL
jgi:hypothetical protein